MSHSTFPPSEGTDDDPGWLNHLYANDKIFIARCDVGWGVFARRHLAAGEDILLLHGPPIDFAETKRRGPRECMAIQVGPDSYIDTQPPGVFVNHACEPNAGVRRNQWLVALIPIPKGSEIRYDYSTTMEEQSFTMTCLCGAGTCRGVVKDFSTLPPLTQARYLSQGVVMSFIAAKLAAEFQMNTSMLGAFRHQAQYHHYPRVTSVR